GQKTVAEERFAAGQALFKEQKFAQAMTEYEAAYAAWPLDGFLCNIAQCHRNLGHVDEAIGYFDRYLVAPNVKNRADVELVVAELRRKKEVAGQPAAETAPAAVVKPVVAVRPEEPKPAAPKTEAPKTEAAKPEPAKPAV